LLRSGALPGTHLQSRLTCTVMGTTVMIMMMIIMMIITVTIIMMSRLRISSFTGSKALPQTSHS